MNKKFRGYQIKLKILYTILLVLGLTLTLTGVVSAANNSSPINNTTTQNTVNPINTTSKQLATNNTTSNQTNITSSGQLNTNSKPTSYSEGTSSTLSSTRTIRVLIYNGDYTIGICVTGIKNALNSANTHNLVPGYHFTYGTSNVINSAILKGYDVLAMPGGTGGSYYLNSGSISGTAIRNFVASGKGYLGICAGAYSGAKYVQGWYNGWGVAPHVVDTHPWVEGNVPIQIQTAGKQLFGYGGIIIMAHYNGPAMYASGGSIVTFATYADNSIGSKGLGAIVGDYYGKGRSVLLGPHPELDPKYPDMLADLFVWAAHLTTNPTSQGTVTFTSLENAASSVKSYYEKTHKLPTNVTISGKTIKMPQLLYLMANAVALSNSGFTSNMTIKKIYPALAPSGSFTAGTIMKSEYLDITIKLISSMNVNLRAPNYEKTTLGSISFNKLVYMFSKIINFYKINHRLPDHVSMTP